MILKPCKHFKKNKGIEVIHKKKYKRNFSKDMGTSLHLSHIFIVNVSWWIFNLTQVGERSIFIGFLFFINLLIKILMNFNFACTKYPDIAKTSTNSCVPKFFAYIFWWNAKKLLIRWIDARIGVSMLNTRPTFNWLWV